MVKFTNRLQNVRISAPCSANWAEMFGNEQVRFCGKCELNVYNLSGMSRREAEALLIRTEGGLCVRYYRKADGTVLTQSCPIGLSALKRRLNRLTTATLSALMSFCVGVGLFRTAFEEESIEGLVPAVEIVKPSITGPVGSPQYGMFQGNLVEGQAKRQPREPPHTTIFSEDDR